VRFKGASPGSIAPMPNLRQSACIGDPGAYRVRRRPKSILAGRIGRLDAARRRAFSGPKSCRLAPKSANHTATFHSSVRASLQSEQCASAKLRPKRRSAARLMTRHHNGATGRSARARHLPSYPTPVSPERE
jgi:hypothetical protein